MESTSRGFIDTIKGRAVTKIAVAVISEQITGVLSNWARDTEDAAG